MAKMSFDLFGALSPTDGEAESKVSNQKCANGKCLRYIYGTSEEKRR